MEQEQTAYAAMLGWFVGDGFGSQTDGMDARTISSLTELPLTEVYSLEEHRPLCGMTSEVSDLGVLLGMSMLATQRFDKDHAWAWYRRYAQEAEESASNELGKIVEGKPLKEDTPYALSRTLVLGLATANQSEKEQSAWVQAEGTPYSSATISLEASLLFSFAFKQLFIEAITEPRQVVQVMAQYAKRNNLDPQLIALLNALGKNSTPQYTQGSLLHTMHRVLDLVLTAHEYESGISTLAQEGGNARLACALFGGLTGALYGLDQIPERWIDEVFPSPTLEAMIKKQTLFKRETIKIERLAHMLCERIPALFS